MQPTTLSRRWRMLGAAMVASLFIVAAAAPWLAPHDPVQPAIDRFGEPQPPQVSFVCGTDELGRDVYSRLLYAARLSLFIAATATALSLCIGAAIGLLAGYAGGWIDALLMRLTDSVQSFPLLLLAIALAALLEPGVSSLLIIIGALGWTGVARTVRGEVLSLRERDYVIAAQAMGAGGRRVMWQHLLPGVVPTLIVLAALNTSNTLLLDAALSFLGLGVPPPMPSWGRMLSESQTYYRIAPWLMFFPGLAIAYAIAAFNLLGHGLISARRRASS